ncbi:MAG: hypothetical protein OXJ53_01160 [Gammaproteobacteria bacterium]|nr:hypothetical protein [Gammaproteobacteria bacterium]MDD9960464.1 hypothetical protein [Gammaproteobacteria bacterium]MDE0270705.1 hypothetical protein [Gammaproteobacteria bacterium]
MKSLILVPLVFFLSVSAWAEGSPWLPVSKSGSLNLSYVSESSKKFYRGKVRGDLPFMKIEQETFHLSADYGLTDSLAIDLEVGVADVSGKAPSPPGPPDKDGTTDVNFGLTWRVLDEDINLGAPSIALRVGATIAGNYGTGVPTSIGDEASGIEASLIVGKILGGRFALSGEIGHRTRNNKVPDETFLNAATFLMATPRLILNAQYQNIMAGGSLDIGGPGFNPGRFPETTEDIERIGFGATFNVNSRLGLGLNWFMVIDGRNTADFDTVAATISYTFDTYGLGGR